MRSVGGEINFIFIVREIRRGGTIMKLEKKMDHHHQSIIIRDNITDYRLIFYLKYIRIMMIIMTKTKQKYVNAEKTIVHPPPNKKYFTQDFSSWFKRNDQQEWWNKLHRADKPTEPFTEHSLPRGEGFKLLNRGCVVGFFFVYAICLSGFLSVLSQLILLPNFHHYYY